jgi:competence protein ComFC
MNLRMDSIKKWCNAGLSFVYPEICQFCRKARAVPEEGYICGGCREQVRRIERPFCERCGIPVAGAVTVTFECAHCRGGDLHFGWARSAVAFEGPVMAAIHRYKYNRALWVEPFLGGLLVERAVPEITASDWRFIVPVPLHPIRMREREFNQAERLGRWLEKATGIPLNTQLLRRVQVTESQTLLTREQRRANIRNAFAAARRPELEGGRILLVDDVVTTGATTSECARALLAAGAAEVCVWTVARGL